MRTGRSGFKGNAKAFTRTYGFLSSILPYTNAGWEKLSIFLNFLIPKLPAPEEDDLSKGILETIDMDSYRVEKQAAVAIQLEDSDAEIGPVPASAGGSKPEPELDLPLEHRRARSTKSSVTSHWEDADRVRRLITEGDPRPRGSRHGLPERHRQLRQAKRADRT